MKTLKRNTYLFYAIEFLSACIFTTAIWAFFFTSYLAFSFSTALVLTVLSGFISFLFEVPSGAWADKFGRKKIYFLGLIFIISGFSIWIFAESIYLFVISAIFQGIGFAITSGNLEALIHDYLELQGKESNYKDIQANAFIYIFIGRALSSLVAGYLFIINPLFPVYGTIVAYSIIFFLLFFIVDKGQKLENNHSTKTHIFTGIKFIFKNNFLFYFVTIVALISATGNIYWFTYQPYLKYIGISIEHIGILFALTGIFSALGAYIIKKLQDNFDEVEIVNISLFLAILAAVGMQFFNIYGALFGIIINSILAGFIMSFGNNVLIKKSPKTYKSTILSIFSLFITIGYVSFSIIAGYILTYTGFEKLYFGVLMLIIGVFIFSILRLKK